MERHSGVASRWERSWRTLDPLWSLTLAQKLGGCVRTLDKSLKPNFSSEEGLDTPTGSRFSTRHAEAEKPDL